MAELTVKPNESAARKPQASTSDKKDLDRLIEALRASDKAMETPRSHRRRLVREYAGRFYGDKYTDNKVNLTALQATTLLPNITIHPVASFRAKRPELRPFAKIFESAVNHRLRELRAAELMDLCVLDAFFGLGIIQTGVAPSLDPEGDWEEPIGWLDDPGQFYARKVDFDDFLWDHTAKTWDSVQYMGHRQRVPFEWVREGGYYDNAEIARLEKVHETRRKASDAGGQSEQMGPDQYMDEIELLHLWLPKKGRIATIAGDLDDARKFLRSDEYEGPEEGPYELLQFVEVPGKLEPGALMARVHDLSRGMNKVFSKIINQAERQKKIAVAGAQYESSANAVRKAQDGDLVILDAPVDKNTIPELSLGGMDPAGPQALAVLHEYLNRLGNNTDVLGGLKPQSRTLGQDQLLNMNATMVVNHLRRQVQAFARGMVYRAAWHLWYGGREDYTDRDVVPVMVDVAGMQVAEQWRPDDREGDFLDYELDIEVRAGQNDGPDERYERIHKWLTEFYLPLASLGLTQGISPNVERAIQVTGDLLGVPVDDLFRSGSPAAQPATQMPAIRPNETNVTLRPGGGPQSMTPQPYQQSASTAAA
jgi:hypothetical protein